MLALYDEEPRTWDGCGGPPFKDTTREGEGYVRTLFGETRIFHLEHGRC